VVREGKDSKSLPLSLRRCTFVASLREKAEQRSEPRTERRNKSFIDILPLVTKRKSPNHKK
jgi:hypothetical protein